MATGKKKAVRKSSAPKRTQRSKVAATERTTSAVTPIEPDERNPSDNAPNPLGFPVVGIGASAGGLDAFKRFLGAVPAGCGIAFVLIPHLDPKQKSMMVELLARCSALPVVEVTEGLAVEANHVYVLPPNKYLTIHEGKLRLVGPMGRHGIQTSIDIFLRSLAEDQAERAISVVLSGTGAHGTLGMKAVKAAGGMAMVQDPKSAEFNQMPTYASATGLADYILPPEKMPAALIGYVRQLQPLSRLSNELPDELNNFIALLRARTKHDFRCYRKRMLIRRIERRMSLNHFDQLPLYLAFLRDHPDELQQLTRDLLISVTNFFRDPEAYYLLETQVLPALIQAHDSETPFRVWVPACATGEEAYSVAIICLEQLIAANKQCRLQIFATDVDEQALDVARRGVYPDSIVADVSPERLSRYFTRVDDHSLVTSKQLREAVTFASQNLISDAPFSKLDLISCRNLLIYLEPEIQKKVIALLHFGLNQGGYLLLGPSETIGHQVDLFEPVSKKWRVYRRIGPDRPDRVEIPIVSSGAYAARRPVDLTATRTDGFRDLAQRLLIDRFAPAAVLINRKHEVLYFHGPTFRYLEQPTGEPTTDVILLAHENLRTKLRAIIHKAITNAPPTASVTARLKRPNGSSSVVITAHAVQSPKSAEGLLLVTFVDVLEVSPSSEGETDANLNDALVRQLEHELTSTQEDLQSSIEELESSNEQLKASNEEVMSMNEELQSSNEELETSKEELQSLNEELGTVNNQLQDKVEELERSTNDLANLLTCTDIATIFLDPQMRIVRFTPATKLLLNLIATDVGRPISDIAPKFSDETLLLDCEEVLRQLIPREHTVRTRDGRWNLRRILPYRTLDNRIDGVVITFTDVTQLKQAEADIYQLNTELEGRVAERTSELEITTEKLQDEMVEREQTDLAMRESRDQLATILDTVAEGIITIDDSGKIRSFNLAAQAMFGYSFEEIAGESVSRLMPDPESADHDGYLATYLQSDIRKIIGIRREVLGRRRNGSTFPMDLTVSELSVGDRHLFTGVMRDISERRELERQVLEIAAEEQRRIGQDLHDSVGQELTGLGLVADSLVECNEKAYPSRPDLAVKIATGIHRILGQVRDLSHGLAPVEVDASGLMSALRELVGRCHEQSGIECTFTCRDPVLVEDNTTATHLYLIAREAVTNAVKHGSPNRVDVRLENNDDTVMLVIQDDGKGLSELLHQEKAGVGLKIMRHRAGLINATLDLKPVTDHSGVVVTCTLNKGVEEDNQSK